MKKHILLGATLLSLMATSCSNEDVIDNGTAVVTGKTITLNATINNGADTRLVYTDNENSMQVAWSNSESFTLYKGTNGTGSTFTKTAESGSKFKGNDITGEGKYYAVYGNNISNNNGTLTIDLSTQVGTNAENCIKEFMLASADALTSETTLSFDHKLTVLKMTLTLPSDVEGTVSMVTVSGLHNKATYDLSKTTDAAYAYADEYYCAITATNGGEGFTIGLDHTITAYVAVFPEAVEANQVKLIANVGFNDYAYTITKARTLTAGKVVPVSASLALVEKNCKSEYTRDDYMAWSNENCSSAPTKEQMKMYLGAGVYWDAGTDNNDGNQQTYTVSAQEYHAGLWVMKKEYISGFSAGTAKTITKVSPSENSDCWHEGRPTDINKYFFLPAAGYNFNFKIYSAGSHCRYWSSEPIDNSYACDLYFDKSSAGVSNDYRYADFLPMVAE